MDQGYQHKHRHLECDKIKIAGKVQAHWHRKLLSEQDIDNNKINNYSMRPQEAEKLVCSKTHYHFNEVAAYRMGKHMIEGWYLNIYKELKKIKQKHDNNTIKSEI